MRGYDEWLDNYGNPGIFQEDDLDNGPTEDQVLSWNETNEYTDQGDQETSGGNAS